MYAVVSTGGKQLKVEKGTVAAVEKLDAAVGEVVTFDVLFVADGDTVVVGSDAATATVTAEVVEHFKGEKQLIFKFKKRKGYKRLKGHRQSQTMVKIIDVIMEGGAKKPAKAAAAKASKAAPVAEKTKAPAAAAPVAVEVVEGQCEAIKADGDRCTKKAKEGSKYCGVHAKKFEE